MGRVVQIQNGCADSVKVVGAGEGPAGRQSDTGPAVCGPSSHAGHAGLC